MVLFKKGIQKDKDSRGNLNLEMLSEMLIHWYQLMRTPNINEITYVHRGLQTVSEDKTMQVPFGLSTHGLRTDTSHLKVCPGHSIRFYKIQSH